METHQEILINLMSFNTYNYNLNSLQFDLCADYISSVFKEIGFSVELIDTEQGKIVIGKRIYNNQFPFVHFSGHYDVVPTNNNSKFGYDLNTKTFWGRGCSDMKGGIVSIWLACKKAIELDLKCNYSISFTPDEEIGGEISNQYLLPNLINFLPYYSTIIIADSSYPNIIDSHRGAYWTEIEISIGMNNRFSKQKISAFQLMCENYNLFCKTPEFTDVIVGGICQSVNAFNICPYIVMFSLDYRFDHPFRIEDVENWVNQHLSIINNKIKSRYPLHNIKMRWQSKLKIEPCICTNDFSEHLDIVRKHISESQVKTGQGFYDLRYFRTAGFKNSFVLGPGIINNAHTVNEHLNENNIYDCSSVYLKIIKELENENI